MLDQSKVGSPSGSGNPPGKHSGGYLKSSEKGGHFVSKKDYRGSMNIGINSSAKSIGNQVKSSSSNNLTGMRTKSI